MTKEQRLKAAEAAYPMLKGLSNSNKITLLNQRLAFVKGAEAEAESKWVSVDVMMPTTHNIHYLVTDGVNVRTAIFCRRTKRDELGFYLSLSNITHWQNLPQLP